MLPVCWKERRRLPSDLLQGRVYADFRKEETYFDAVFDFFLSVYRIPPQHAVAAELRNSLKSAD